MPSRAEHQRWISVEGRRVQVVRRPPKAIVIDEAHARRLGALYLAYEDAVLSGRTHREENDT